MDRHVILTLGRSGSNTLRDMMNQNPQVLNFGEVLGDWNTIRKIQKRVPLMPRSNEAYLDWILYSPSFPRLANGIRTARKRLARETGAKRLRDVKTFGIKDFSLNFRRCGLTGYLDARPDIKVIGLQRENVVDRMISNAMLGATGVIEVRNDTSDGPRRLRLDPARVGGLLADIETENADLQAMLGRLPAERVMSISYDDLFSDQETRHQIMSEVFRFLDVTDHPTNERMKKIIKAPVREVIENFDDCLNAVRGTPREDILRAAAGD